MKMWWIDLCYPASYSLYCGCVAGGNKVLQFSLGNKSSNLLEAIDGCSVSCYDGRMGSPPAKIYWAFFRVNCPIKVVIFCETFITLDLLCFDCLVTRGEWSRPMPQTINKVLSLKAAAAARLLVLIRYIMCAWTFGKLWMAMLYWESKQFVWSSW